MSVYRRLGAALVVVTILAVAGCHEHRAQARLAPAWREVTLPAPAGPAGRLVLRDATFCADRWYIVGAVVTPDNVSRPAAWVSQDAVAWTAVTISASTYYGQLAYLYTVGCRDGVIAAVGGKSGGAHGNPRVTNWRLLPDGTLTEVIVPGFETFGGPNQGNATRIVGGPAGWLITGVRAAGASVWVSTDATYFNLVEAPPRMGNDATRTTAALDAVPDGSGWLVVGTERRVDAIDRDPAVWTSPDGRAWTESLFPRTGEDEALQRVVQVDGILVAVGVHGSTFGAWRRDGGTWRVAGRFGVAGGNVAAIDDGIAVPAGRVCAAVVTVGGRSLWCSSIDAAHWIPVSIPLSIGSGADEELTIAGNKNRLLVIGDDGRAGRAFVTDLSPAS
jgi:hypothetical protein